MDGEKRIDYRGWHIYTAPTKDGRCYVAVARSSGDPVDESVKSTEEKAVEHGKMVVDGCEAHGGKEPCYSFDVDGKVRVGW